MKRGGAQLAETKIHALQKGNCGTTIQARRLAKQLCDSNANQILLEDPKNLVLFSVDAFLITFIRHLVLDDMEKNIRNGDLFRDVGSLGGR